MIVRRRTWEVDLVDVSRSKQELAFGSTKMGYGVEESMSKLRLT